MGEIELFFFFFGKLERRVVSFIVRGPDELARVISEGSYLRGTRRRFMPSRIHLSLLGSPSRNFCSCKSRSMCIKEQMSCHLGAINFECPPTEFTCDRNKLFLLRLDETRISDDFRSNRKEISFSPGKRLYL